MPYNISTTLSLDDRLLARELGKKVLMVLLSTIRIKSMRYWYDYENLLTILIFLSQATDVTKAKRMLDLFDKGSNLDDTIDCKDFGRLFTWIEDRYCVIIDYSLAFIYNQKKQRLVFIEVARIKMQYFLRRLFRQVFEGQAGVDYSSFFIWDKEENELDCYTSRGIRRAFFPDLYQPDFQIENESYPVVLPDYYASKAGDQTDEPGVGKERDESYGDRDTDYSDPKTPAPKERKTGLSFFAGKKTKENAKPEKSSEAVTEEPATVDGTATGE